MGRNPASVTKVDGGTEPCQFACYLFLVRSQYTQQGRRTHHAQLPARCSGTRNYEVCPDHQCRHVRHVFQQPYRTIRLLYQPSNIRQVRTAAAHDNRQFQVRLREKNLQDLLGDILRIAAAHAHQNPARSRSNLKCSFPPECKLTPQQDVAWAQEEPRIRRAFPVKIFFGVYILIQHEIGRIRRRRSVIIDQKQFQAGISDRRLVRGIELVSIHHGPLGFFFVGQVAHLGRVLHSAGQTRQTHDIGALHLHACFNRGRCLGHRECNLPTRILPRLGQRQTPHRMARAHRNAGITSNQQGSRHSHSSRTCSHSSFKIFKTCPSGLPSLLGCHANNESPLFGLLRSHLPHPVRSYRETLAN